MEEKQTIKSRWAKLDGVRNTILSKARRCASVTIPSLMPPEGADENASLKTPYQGLGTRGVNNLASKLLLTLLPPNSPFFRLQIDDFTLEELNQAGARAEVEKALNKIERAVMGEVETKALRVPTFEALRLLIVTGNALLFLPDQGGMKVFRLDQYVIKRDPMGHVLEIITKEKIHPIVLPEEIRRAVNEKVKDTEEEVDLFTYVKRTEEGIWEVSQECADVPLPDSEGTYPLDESPWIPLRWTSLAGENYGRGMVEEYLGDFLTLEALTKAITEGAAMAARVIGLVNPNGTTRPKKLVQAKNGDFIEGNADDVTYLQLEKFNDFRIAFEKSMQIEQRLAYAFLLMQSVQRDAERVTAEEIRQMAKELEDSLGGVYSVLSQELQLPLVKRLMVQMTKDRRLPELPKNIVQPAVVTGLEALGRGNDLNRLTLFLQSIEPLKDLATPYLRVGDYLVRVGTALGIDTNGLIKSEEEIRQEQETAQLEALTAQTVPGMAQEMTKGMVNGGG